MDGGRRLTRTVEGHMGACIIGDGRDLTLDTGDGAYIMRDVMVNQWTMVVGSEVPIDVTSRDDHVTRAVRTSRRVDCTISLTSHDTMYSVNPIPRQIETYSVTDMLHMINAKLQERAG